MPDPPSTEPPERLAQRAYRFARALIVGSGATLGDVSVLTLCVRVFGVAATTARLPALVAGACIQFFGNRGFTFRASRGRLGRQAWRFVLAESLALFTNYMVFRALEPRLHSHLAPELISFIGTFVVFVGFSYPMRRLVIFRLRPDERGPPADRGRF